MNFLLLVHEEGKENKKHGFYVTRDVEAESPAAAELKAVDLVRNEEGVRNRTMNRTDDPPMLVLDSIRVLDPHEESLNNSGRIFYLEEVDGIVDC